jgi:hypothetical protein
MLTNQTTLNDAPQFLKSEGWGRIENINKPTVEDNQTMWKLLHSVVQYHKDVDHPEILYYRVID